MFSPTHGEILQVLGKTERQIQYPAVAMFESIEHAITLT